MELKPVPLSTPSSTGRCFFACAITCLFFLTVSLLKPEGLMQSVGNEVSRPPIASDGSERRCSFHVFKEYVRDSPFFPTGGNWTWKEGLPSHFKPTLCTFREGELSPTFVSKCLLEKRITRVLILGDSQGARDFTALNSVLTKNGFVCNITKAEGRGKAWEPNISYYVNGTTLLFESIQIKRRACHGCLSTAASCVQADIKLHVEYLSMEYYHDQELTTIDVVSKGKKSNTTQEFYFKEYLRENYPDVIFLFGNNHFNRVTLKRNRLYIQQLAQLLRRSVPSSTAVVWISSGPEYSPKKTGKWKKARSNNDTRHIEKHVRAVNKALFDQLKPLLIKEYSNFLPFPDLQGMADEVEVLNKLSLDGIHMHPVWYEFLMSSLLQALCDSDLDLLLGTARTRQL